MSKKVILIGHCGPDASYLKSAVYSAAKGVTILAAHDDREIEKLIAAGVDLLLINRQLEYGFSTDNGNELIRSILAAHPGERVMLVSNYPEAQADAIAAGARPGFGKREIGSQRVTQLIHEALEASAESGRPKVDADERL